jgi:hypothetical protein
MPDALEEPPAELEAAGMVSEKGEDDETDGVLEPFYTPPVTAELDEEKTSFAGESVVPIGLDDDEEVGMAVDEPEAATAVLPPSPDREAQLAPRRGTPAWVWLVMLLFLLAVAVFLYAVFMTTAGNGFP